MKLRRKVMREFGLNSHVVIWEINTVFKSSIHIWYAKICGKARSNANIFWNVIKEPCNIICICEEEIRCWNRGKGKKLYWPHFYNF